MMLVSKGISQVRLAENAGIDRYSLNRWCRPTLHRVRKKNLELLARGLHMELAALLRECGTSPVARHHGEDDRLSPAEREMVKKFRSLAPLEQAKVLIHCDEMVTRLQAP